MAGIKANRQEALRSFRNLCETTGFGLEPHQVKIAGMLLGPQQEKLVTLPRKNGKSRLVGAFAAWHLLNTPEAQAVVVANSKEQAEIIDRYARQVAMHPSVEREFEPRFRELRGPDGSTLQIVGEARRYCRDHGIEMLIVDTFDKWSGLRGDDENKSGPCCRRSSR